MNELRAHQMLAISALEQIDTICKENSIPYFLIAGSVLGAIRHQGFIPWDDDVDVGMCAEAYDKFLSVMRCRKLPSPFLWEHIDVNASFPRMTGRITYNNVSVMSVFAIVRKGDTWFGQRWQWAMKKLWPTLYQRKLRWKNPKHKSFRRKVNYALSYFASLFVSKDVVLKAIRANERRYEGKETKDFINLYSRYSMEKETIRGSWIVQLMDVPFEGKLYPVFSDHDAYLTHLYGDYRKLPPESERVPVHVVSQQ